MTNVRMFYNNRLSVRKCKPLMIKNIHTIYLPKGKFHLNFAWRQTLRNTNLYMFTATTFEFSSHTRKGAVLLHAWSLWFEQLWLWRCWPPPPNAWVSCGLQCAEQQHWRSSCAPSRILSVRWTFPHRWLWSGLECLFKLRQKSKTYCF